MAKYALLRQRVAAELPGCELRMPEAATDGDLLRVHTARYLEAVKGGLDAAAARRIGFPWSLAMVERSRRSVGGTMGAARAALGAGVAVNLAGGTHHAFADAGEGFCVFNDTAVAARAMQAEGRARRLAVLDLDVHQGNGTAAIFRGDDGVFTASVHGERNYPFRKETSDLDLPLADGATDEAYLAAVDTALRATLASAPDLVFYLSGADPFEGDRLGRLAVTRAGLVERDRRVLEGCARVGIPVAVVMGGGYAAAVEDTVAIHFETIRAALEVHDHHARARSTSR